MRRLDAQLDSIFADTFHNLGHWFGDSKLASSIDLREQKNKYVVRVYLPDANSSKVSARVENNMLHVVATEQEQGKNNAQSERYEQIMSLPGPVQSDKMKITRKKNLFVITLPKAPSAVAAASPAPSANPASPAPDWATLDESMINQMNQMQGRMEQIFQDAFPQDLTHSWNQLHLGSAVHLDDQKDQYVVRFYLPDKDLKNVNVKLDNGQLRLTASETESKQQKGFSSQESGRYEQLLTLPGPVKEKGMKVDRKEGTIVVTLPKA